MIQSLMFCWYLRTLFWRGILLDPFPYQLSTEEKSSAEKSPLMTKSIPTSRHGRERLERHRLACKNSVTPVFNTLNSSFLYLVSILVVLLLWWLDQQVCKCEWANYLGGEVFDSSICFSFIHSALYTDCVWAPRVLQTRPLFQWLV